MNIIDKIMLNIMAVGGITKTLIRNRFDLEKSLADSEAKFKKLRAELDEEIVLSNRKLAEKKGEQT